MTPLAGRLKANTGMVLRRNWNRERFWGGKYRLEKRAGRGGMGEVWKAFDTIGERDVALKFVPKDVQRYEHEMQRVKETFKVVHALNHQYICPVHALEEDPVHGFYLVMKWLDGYTLDEAYKHIECNGNRLPIQYVPQLLECVAEALDYAHNHGVVHRDIKPTNIFVNIQNEKVAEVNLIDFGLASEIRESMTRVSQVQFNTSGTRPYMPPEQWRGRKQDARTDQYSLAVVAYELYAGNLPFSGADFDMLRAAVMNDAPEKIKNIPDNINAALQKALSKNREDRFDTCMIFINALNAKDAPNPPFLPKSSTAILNEEAEQPAQKPLINARTVGGLLRVVREGYIRKRQEKKQRIREKAMQVARENIINKQRIVEKTSRFVQEQLQNPIYAGENGKQLAIIQKKVQDELDWYEMKIQSKKYFLKGNILGVLFALTYTVFYNRLFKSYVDIELILAIISDLTLIITSFIRIKYRCTRDGIFTGIFRTLSVMITCILFNHILFVLVAVGYELNVYLRIFCWVGYGAFYGALFGCLISLPRNYNIKISISENSKNQ